MTRLLFDRISIARTFGLVLLVSFLAACGTPDTTETSEPPTETETETTTETPTKTPDEPDSAAVDTPEPPEQQPLAAGAEEQTVEIYWLTGDDTIALAPTPITVKANSNQPDALLEAAFEQLFSEPADAQIYTVVPEGTQLRQVSVKPDGVYVDLSSEFATTKAVAAINASLAQVVYTATSLQPEASVWLSVDGEPLTRIDGEGIDVPQPLNRQIIDEEFMF
ncbi:MAG: GerMN domain-containing protein [Cyanobacteriota bacterium]|nr:GerMN domain-containing protein [Cyanobacteriota bacterium]